MYILGISAFYHDSAATLIKNGEIIAAVQEERFTRKKHDSGYPTNAIDYVLREANILINDIDKNLDSFTSLFADDTRVLREVKDEEDVEKLQADLNILYEWQKKNNMEFNGKKFEVLWYGSNTNIKESTVYFTPNFDDVIKEKYTVRDWAKKT